MKSFRKILASTLALVLCLAVVLGVPAQAATAPCANLDSPSDILGNEFYSSIQALYDRGALADLISEGQFRPSSPITQAEFCSILSRLFINQTLVQNSWISSTIVTQLWATSVLQSISTELGHKVSWSGGAPYATVNRDLACSLIVGMLDCDNGYLWYACRTNSSTTCSVADFLGALWRIHDGGKRFSDYLSWAKQRDLVGPTECFELANLPCTRAYAVWALWCLAGSPSVHSYYSNIFTDVPTDASYRAAVAWAASCGITYGTSQTTFSPLLNISRDSANIFLQRSYGQNPYYPFYWL